MIAYVCALMLLVPCTLYCQENDIDLERGENNAHLQPTRAPQTADAVEKLLHQVYGQSVGEHTPLTRRRNQLTEKGQAVQATLVSAQTTDNIQSFMAGLTQAVVDNQSAIGQQNQQITQTGLSTQNTWGSLGGMAGVLLLIGAGFLIKYTGHCSA